MRTAVLSSVSSIVLATISMSPALAAQGSVPAARATSSDAGPPPLLINEVDADQTSTDSVEFLELIGVPGLPLQDHFVVLYNGNAANDAEYRTFDLDGQLVPPDGFFVLGAETVPEVDWTPSNFPATNAIQNGADAVALWFDGSGLVVPADFFGSSPGAPPPGVQLVDAVVYGTSDPEDVLLLDVLTPGQPQVDEDANGLKDTQSIQRIPDGGLPFDTASYQALEPTAGLPNGGTGEQADFSAASQVDQIEPSSGADEPSEDECVKHEVRSGVGCGNNGTPTGDGDGDGAVDDCQQDINGSKAGTDCVAPNGTLSQWCMNCNAGNPQSGHYALVWDPAPPGAGGGGPRFVGKCPFGGGINAKCKLVDVKTGNIKKIIHESEDGGGDDDGDGKKDVWEYEYDTGTDMVDQCHTEDGVKQDDGATKMPKEKPFGFGDLLPKDPEVDDPDPAAGSPDPGVPSGDGDMIETYPRIPLATPVTLGIETVVANEGPLPSADAVVDVTVTAPPGATVDGGPSATRTTTVTVTDAAFERITDLFTIESTTPGIAVFEVDTAITPLSPTVVDPVSSDDTSATTVTILVSNDAWIDVGCALAGVSGDPVLEGTGDLSGGSLNAVDLTNAAPSATAGVFIALSSTPVPFKGGTLKPIPFLIPPVILSTDGTGAISLPFVMPAGVPGGTELWVQWAISDGAAINGVSLSNAVLGVTP